MAHTVSFYGFLRGVSSRRSVLLLNESKEIFYPPRGSFWEPSKIDEAKCDAFILFFVAELEVYFEGILEDTLNIYKSIYSIYFLRHCGGGKDFITSISTKLTELSRNHNANWSKIKPYFEFVGMGKESHFPFSYWDDIESIVSHRGQLVHKGVGMSSNQDRRDIIYKIEVTIKRTRELDLKFKAWHNQLIEEKVRISASSFDFTPTFGQIV